MGSSSDMLEQQQQPITAYGFPNAETRGQFGVQSQQSAGAKNAAAAGQQPVLNQQQKEALVKKALKNDKVL